MKIAIIGAGNMAQGIGARVLSGGNELTIYDRNFEKAQELAKKLGNVKAEILSETIEGDIIILALPYYAIPEVVSEHAGDLKDKIIVDISNPVDFQTFKMIPPAESSGAEELVKLIPPNAKLVKAFNTTFAGTLLAGSVNGMKLDVLVAGDDQEAKKQVMNLVEQSGLRALDAGPLSHARYLEGIQLIQMSAQEQLGSNWMSSIKFIQ